MLYFILNIFLIFNISLFSEKYESFNQDEETKAYLNRLQDSIEFSSDIKIIEKALKDFNETAKKTKNEYLLAKSDYNTGIYGWLSSDYRSAIESFYRSYTAAADINDTLLQINSAIYLGLVYGRLKDWELTEKYYKSAYKLSLDYKDEFSRASASWNMAYLYSELKEYEKSLDFCDKSIYHLNNIKSSNDNKKHFGYGLAYYYYGLNYYNSEVYDSALTYMKLSIKENEKLNNKAIILSAMVTISYIYYEMEEYDKAIDYGMITHHMDKDLIEPETLSWSYESIANAYRGKRQYDSAFKYMKLYAHSLDTLNKLDTRIHSAKLEIEKQEKDFKKEQELANQKFIFTVTIAAILIVFLLTVIRLVFSRYKLKNKLNEELKKLNETKDKFFSIISHDLKGPISSFNNISNILINNFDDYKRDELKKHLKSMTKSSERLNMLTENLLTWARLQQNDFSPDMKKTDLYEIAEEESENLKTFSEKKGVEIYNFIPEQTFVSADKYMISQVVRNLLANAVKFSFRNGRIEILHSNKGKKIAITVKDFGAGIDEKIKDKLFDISNKTTNTGTAGEKGTGLGLYLAKEFVDKHDGEIYCESNKGKGTEFNFTLNKY